jgi:hypothetical protein
MRADMFKVIVERPRWGHRERSPKLRRIHDPHVKFMGHKRHVWESRGYAKFFNENLAPLIRFLRSRIGRRWDDVYSEICAELDTGSTVKMHVRQHLDDFVMRIALGRNGEWMHDGRLLDCERLRWRRPLFYVDPDDGILKDAAGLLRVLQGDA